MAIKKSQLYSTLWESCNALRGSMDASQYKDYVLIILFVKYLSDKAHKDQTDLEVPDGCYFEDFVTLKQNPHIGEEINKKLEKICEANTAFLGGLTLPNFNDDAKLGSGKTKVETLSKLIGEFERDELDFSRNRAADDDLLGDAYEYLMKNFAVESGKSKGQFYTPAEVSRVIAKVLKLKDLANASNTIYDMTCGSGSLLLRALSETKTGKPKLYGQEKDSSTASLARLNMLLHGVVNAEIQVGDTLNDPKFKTGSTLDVFDVCVANPPFSQKNWLNTNGEEDEFGRWSPSLLPPENYGDFAFLLHLIASMKSGTGQGACILPHGVLFRGTEYTIRKHIVEKHYLSGIVGLPPNLFFGAGISACILILDKKDLHSRKGIFFIDAKEGFIKDGNINRLREQDIKRIVDTWNLKKDIPHYARLVGWDEIERNDYNLNISRYVQPRDTEIRQDIEAHLHGGIPVHDVSSMERYWSVCADLKDALFTKRKDGRYDLAVDKADIAQTIRQNKSFLAQQAVFDKSLDTWKGWARRDMRSIGKNGRHPKELIDVLGTILLTQFKADKSLADPYAVYDHLMNYWAETMQDDCYMIYNDGWTVSWYVIQKKKTKKKDGDTDTAPKKTAKKKIIYTDIVCDLLPVEVLLRTCFVAEMKDISDAQQVVEDRLFDMDSYVDEHSETFDDILKEDDGKESSSKKNNGKVSEKDVKAALKEAKGSTDKETIKAYYDYLALVDMKKRAAKELRDLQEALTKKVIEKYESLETKPDEIKHLVIEEKWLYDIFGACREEMQNIAQGIASMATTLATRYEQTLPSICADVSKHEQEVSNFLKQMGFNF